MALEASELILNPDSSIYHLNIKPEELADTVITVGDPDRVDKVTAFFDHIEFKRQKREFHTQTGTYKGLRITVISTGIGTDNIDIVLNELDALANIDFRTRQLKSELRALDIIRIGTSGAMHASTPIDSFLISEAAVGFDSLWHYYQHPEIDDQGFLQALQQHLQLSDKLSSPYYVEADSSLVQRLSSDQTIQGITATNVGFYAPQGRNLRAVAQRKNLVDEIAKFEFNGRKITNMEMETSGIYALSTILGHRAISMNAMLANRATGQFSPDPKALTKRLIQYVLDKLVS